MNGTAAATYSLLSKMFALPAPKSRKTDTYPQIINSGEKMKVLVSGAAGFIGSNLAQKLVRRGDEVIGLDNFNDYYNPAKKRANEKRLVQYPNFRMIEADIRDRPRMIHIFEEEGFDAVAHLAAMAGVRPAVESPDFYVEVDYIGTQHLMDAARFTNVGNFVFASTSSVYGDTKQIPFVETDPCDRPLQPYAAAKRAAEILGFTYHYLYDLNFTAIRFFTVYGPNGRPDMMAYLVADSITKGNQIPIYNGGEMYRDWTFVDDITNGAMAAVDRPLGYEVINLGRGEPTRLKEFVGLIEDLAGQKANLVDKPKPAADVVSTYADISKAVELLGYAPKVSVSEGVEAFWNWYVENG
jgi:UDP-glucuronate 4-epimerase